MKAMSNAGGSGGAWQPSPKLAQLHRSLLESLNEKDRANFAKILDYYQRSKNVQRLVESLNGICRTPQQREDIYPLLRAFIPRKDRERFDYECIRPRSAYGRHHTYSKRQFPTYYNHTTRSLPEEVANYRWNTPSSLCSGRETPVGPPSGIFEPTQNRAKGKREKKTSDAKVILLERDQDGGESFGFSIRGGAEYNVGLFVSSIDEGSVAESAGLCCGDQVMEANRIDFNNLSHQQAVGVIQQTASLHLLVKSVGKVPGTFKSSSSYRWIDPKGNEVSPPSEYTTANLSGMNKSEMRLLGGEDERKVNLFVADGAELGLKIRGGSEHGLGIFIASVDANSGAERAGFQVGDQILDVNGKSFVDISHKEAVKVLKNAQRMVIKLKDLGVLPHGKKVQDETRWIREVNTKNSARPSSADSNKKKTTKAEKRPSFYERMGSSQLTHHSVVDHSEEILEIKARQVLDSHELDAFTFYLNEYRKTQLSLTLLLSAFSDLLKTSAKKSLFQEIRSAILPRDLVKFDEWMEKQENLEPHQSKHDRQSLYSYKSSDSSTNSWLGFFEVNNDQQRKEMDALPDPPREILDFSWDTDNTSSYPGRTQRTISLENFPPPPVFLTDNEHTPEKHLVEENRPPVQDVSGQRQDLGNNRHDLPRYKNTMTTLSPKVNFHRTAGTGGLEYEDELYSAVDPRDTGGSSNVLSPRMHSNTTVRTSMVNDRDTEDRLYDAVDYKDRGGSSGNVPHTVDDWDTEDGMYTAVNHKDINGSSFNASSPVFGKTNKTKQIRENKQGNMSQTNNADIIPLYATVHVDKSARKNKHADSKDTNSSTEDLDTPPIVPEKNFTESDVALLEENRKPFQNGGFDKNEGSNESSNPLELRKENSTTLEFSREFTSKNRITNGHKGPSIDTKIATYPDRIQELKKSGADNARNASSTQRSKKLRKSRSNIAQTATQQEEQNPGCKTFVVELTKHSSNLGLAITGGMDTDSREIRIKSVKSGNTVAGSCPLLKPGQIILGVDEKSLQNVTSGIAAMAIRQAFHSDKSVFKLILENDSR